MKNGLNSRLIVHKALKLIKVESVNFEDALKKITNINELSTADKKFIFNLSLTTLRNYIFLDKIIFNIVKKLNKESDNYFLLLSAMSQIIFLKVKEYAVVNCAVEISKRKDIRASSSLINACLRNFIKKKESLVNEKIGFSELPEWFIKRSKNLTNNQKNSLITNINKQPSLHIVLSNNVDTSKYDQYGTFTSNNSLAIHNKFTFTDIPNYKDGEWWVQDFSSMLPISLIDIDKNQNIADVGSAPGGKLFQITQKTTNVTAYEKNTKRIVVLNDNLKRLKINKNIEQIDFLQLNDKKKYDFIVLDAPCSSVGTIKRNPEIFFKKKAPNFNFLLNIQYNFLEKSKNILNKNGIILYMVCSFLEDETYKQINKFLKRNKNFSLKKFNVSSNPNSKEFIDNSGIVFSTPKTILSNIGVDGYFACMLKKNDISN